MANSVDDFEVYQKAVAASGGVSKILQRESFKKDLRLREQLGSASERVASAISEGFEQSTDRHFAQYLYRARGSTREVRTQLIVARDRHHINESERLELTSAYEEVARMATGLIRYLEREDRKHRR